MTSIFAIPVTARCQTPKKRVASSSSLSATVTFISHHQPCNSRCHTLSKVEEACRQFEFTGAVTFITQTDRQTEKQKGIQAARDRDTQSYLLCTAVLDMNVFGSFSLWEPTCVTIVARKICWTFCQCTDGRLQQNTHAPYIRGFE